MNADDLAAKERARRRPPSDENVNENVKRVGAAVDPQQALSELDQRIANQQQQRSSSGDDADAASKSRARRQAAAGSSVASPVNNHPGAYSVSTPSAPKGTTPTAAAATTTPTTATPTDPLSKLEMDVAAKSRVRNYESAAVVAMAPAVYQVEVETETTTSGGGPTNLSQVERDVANKASSRPAASAGASLTMTPGAYQVAAVAASSASGKTTSAATSTDADIKAARGRSSNVSQVEVAVADKAPTGTTRMAAVAAASGGTAAAATPGHSASLIALEVDVEAKSRGGTSSSNSNSPTPAPQVVGAVAMNPTQTHTQAAGTTTSTLEERIAYKTGITLGDDDSKGGQGTGAGTNMNMLTKLQDSYRLNNKDGQHLQGDLKALEVSYKDLTAAPRGRNNNYDGIGGPNHHNSCSLDPTENLTVAVAVEEEDVDKFLASAVEYDPDSKPPIYKNRRFRWYSTLMGVLLFAMICGLVFGFILGKDDYQAGTSNDQDGGATSAPTTYRASLGIQQTIELVIPSHKLNDPSTSHYRALQWILHEDPKALGPDDPTLTQRFILALFYFETSEESPWYYCAPPDLSIGEDPEICFVRQYSIGLGSDLIYSSKRWLSDDDECIWAGIDCNDVDQIIEINLRKYCSVLYCTCLVSPCLELNYLVLP
jgi:hypothetical protein